MPKDTDKKPKSRLDLKKVSFESVLREMRSAPTNRPMRSHAPLPEAHQPMEDDKPKEEPPAATVFFDLLTRPPLDK